MQTESRPILLRIYAILFALYTIFYEVVVALHSGDVMSYIVMAFYLVASFGIATWAFGYYIGPARFWKCVAVLFTIVILCTLPSFITDMAGQWPEEGKHSTHMIVTTIFCSFILFTIFGPACLALFRAGNPDRY